MIWLSTNAQGARQARDEQSNLGILRGGFWSDLIEVHSRILAVRPIIVGGAAHKGLLRLMDYGSLGLIKPYKALNGLLRSC